jgi:hypothetical protein
VALYLAERIPAGVHGISISPRQIAHARRRASRRVRALSGTCSFHEGDFCRLPSAIVDAVAGADLVYAIESFVHAESAAAFFDHVARVLRPGGQLVLVDDVLTSAGVRAGGHPAIEAFRAGWQAGSLVGAEQAVELAAGSGLALVSRTCLSPYMRLGRPRDRVVRAMQPLLRRGQRYSHWCQSLVGGDALQRCHLLGLMEYDELVLVRAWSWRTPARTQGSHLGYVRFWLLWVADQPERTARRANLKPGSAQFEGALLYDSERCARWRPILVGASGTGPRGPRIR